MKVQGRRNMGRPTRRWLDRLRDYQREGTVAGGSVRICFMEAYVIVQRPHIKVGIKNN